MNVRTVGQAVLRSDHRLGHSWEAHDFLTVPGAGSLRSGWGAWSASGSLSCIDFSFIAFSTCCENKLALELLLLRELAPFLGGPPS